MLVVLVAIFALSPLLLSLLLLALLCGGFLAGDVAAGWRASPATASSLRTKLTDLPGERLGRGLDLRAGVDDAKPAGGPPSSSDVVPLSSNWGSAAAGGGRRLKKRLVSVLAGVSSSSSGVGGRRGFVFRGAVSGLGVDASAGVPRSNRPSALPAFAACGRFLVCDLLVEEVDVVAGAEMVGLLDAAVDMLSDPDNVGLLAGPASLVTSGFLAGLRRGVGLAAAARLAGCRAGPLAGWGAERENAAPPVVVDDAADAAPASLRDGRQTGSLDTGARKLNPGVNILNGNSGAKKACCKASFGVMRNVGLGCSRPARKDPKAALVDCTLPSSLEASREWLEEKKKRNKVSEEREIKWNDEND